jgi:hypothetical protein
MIELTETQKRQAFARAWHVSWPVDYDEAMKNEVIAKIVETIARNVPAMNRRNTERNAGLNIFRSATGNAAALHCDERSPSPRIPRQRPILFGLDQKRKAAGERDDD